MNFIFPVIPSAVIRIDDGEDVTYNNYINVTCVENLLMDAFSGWQLDLPKPFDQIENITCVQNIYCDYGSSSNPIPVSNDSVEFSLHLDFLGQRKMISGPMSIGDSMSINCIEKGNSCILCVRNTCNKFWFPDYHFDMEIMYFNRYYPVQKIIATVSLCMHPEVYLLCLHYLVYS